MASKTWSRLTRALRVLVFVYVGIVVLMMLLERFLVYPAPPKDDGNWDVSELNVEDVYFESGDGTKLHGFYAEHTAPRGHMLFCHGNGEHIGYFPDSLVRLSRELQLSVFAFDYRGYGKSEGQPFEQGLLEDGEAALTWLTNRGGIEMGQAILHGRSLGGGVVVYLAGKHGARALVAERTFHSMVEIGARQYPWLPVRLVMRNRYPSAERIASYHGPLLQLHGDADRLVPLSSAKLLFAACPSQDKQFMTVPGMGHNDPNPPEFLDAFLALLDRLPPQVDANVASQREP